MRYDNFLKIIKKVFCFFSVVEGGFNPPLSLGGPTTKQTLFYVFLSLNIKYIFLSFCKLVAEPGGGPGLINCKSAVINQIE